jgi:uncharacterized protein with GYD domain
MPKYLLAVSYTAEGAKGVAKTGGSARVTAARELAEGLGGSLESMYFAFGPVDVYAVVDMPSQAAAAAAVLALGASGAAGSTTTVLITPEEVDEASRMAVTYRPPGA